MNTSANLPARPVLSIIVPAYDAQHFVKACLNAIVPQMGPGHELIVVDDGSRDRTAEFVEAVCAHYPYLDTRVVRQQNQGIAGARNRGLLEARGEYILFVDADDLLLPGALAAIEDVVAHYHPDVVACDFKSWQPDKERKSRHIELGYPPARIITDTDAILQTFFADRHMYVWANVVRREVYARLPQPVFPAGRVFEDVSVLSRLLSECRSLYRLAVPAIAYRQHPASLTKTISAKWCVDFASAIKQVRTTFSVLPASEELRMQIDVTACHFYIGIVKNSYQLSWSEGRAAREQVREVFLATLFHDINEVLATMEQARVASRSHAHDLVVARQVRLALRESLAFALAMAASRKIKLWQRMTA
jgi:glycosyltransferase involved in cell wall biosynthesis